MSSNRALSLFPNFLKGGDEPMIFVFTWIAGFAVGILTPIIWRNILASGTVEIDVSDPDIPYLRLHVSNKQLDNLPRKKYVLFKVDPNAKFTRQKQSL